MVTVHLGFIFLYIWVFSCKMHHTLSSTSQHLLWPGTFMGGTFPTLYWFRVFVWKYTSRMMRMDRCIGGHSAPMMQRPSRENPNPIASYRSHGACKCGEPQTLIKRSNNLRENLLDGGTNHGVLREAKTWVRRTTECRMSFAGPRWCWDGGAVL